MIHTVRLIDATPASSLPVALAQPSRREIATTPAPIPPIPEPTPIRHLLIGSSEAVQHTIHRLHNLRYAEAGFWSPAIAPANSQLVIPLNPHEVMRILVRSLRVIG